MASIHRKLKLAFIEHHEEGPVLVVRAKDNEERLELALTGPLAALLLKQLSGVLTDCLTEKGKP